MTIQEIKERTAETAPFYFTPKTLKFFGQTLKSFKVTKQPDGRFKIAAPIKDKETGKVVGESVRYFNPGNNTLEHN